MVWLQLGFEEGHGAISGKTSTPCSTPESKNRLGGIIIYNVLRKCLKFESDELIFSQPLK